MIEFKLNVVINEIFHFIYAGHTFIRPDEENKIFCDINDIMSFW